jgi:hypothetical protein
MGAVLMASKQYQYTFYNQNGDVMGWKGGKMEYDQIKRTLGEGCTMLELIPKDYWPEGVKFGEMWGDEEGRFNSGNHRNPHFKVLVDEFGHHWDCVGNILHIKAIR